LSERRSGAAVRSTALVPGDPEYLFADD